MAKATFVKKCDGFNGDARLYKTEGGDLPEYVIVSAVNVMYTGDETYIFAADADGEVTSWGALDGSFHGELDHERALRRAGYEVVSGA